MQFRGRLRHSEDTGPGLPISVILDNARLTIETDGDKLGSWSLSEVSAVRTSSDRFAMSFGAEQMIFEADDTLGFSYEALPHIDGRRARSGVLTKIRTAFTLPDSPSPLRSIDLREDPVSEIVSTHADTVAATEEATDLPSEKCKGLRRDGQPCRSSIVLASGFCTSHDPNRPPMRSRNNPVDDPSLSTVFKHLERAVGDVKAGRMNPEAALALASLAQAMCATVDADEALQVAARNEILELRSVT